MKTLVTLAIILATRQIAFSQQNEKEALPPAPEGKTWKLVWHDEFDGTKLDETKWDIPEYKRRDGYWSRKSISLDGEGHLVMSNLKDGDKFLDGCVRTRGKFEHSFGYYVARVQLQKQPGHWSAFWIMGDGVSKVGSGGRDGTEIDIYEKPWLDDRVQHTLHWDGYGKDHKSEGKVVKVPGVMEGWHTFGLWWKPDEYIFYVDGKESWRTKSAICQVPEYIKLSDEIGDWGGDITKAKLPDAFLVDYVRVYDLVENASSRSSNRVEYFGWESHGDKPAIGLRLVVEDNAIIRGTLSILSPDYPTDKKSVDYPLFDIGHNGAELNFRVRIRDKDKMVTYSLSGRILERTQEKLEVQFVDSGVANDVPTRISLHKQGSSKL